MVSCIYYIILYYCIGFVLSILKLYNFLHVKKQISLVHCLGRGKIYKMLTAYLRPHDFYASCLSFQLNWGLEPEQPGYLWKNMLPKVLKNAHFDLQSVS